jgi:GntR family transcriptional regulator
MPEPAYVAIAGDYARKIRSGELPAGMQLPSHSEIASRFHVSDIVVRKAIDLLAGQGLVRSVRRRGVFVADRQNLVRVSPERQMEDPESTYSHESVVDVQIEREVYQTAADDFLAEAFGISVGEPVTHTITRASEGGRPISVSDTYQPTHLSGIDGATMLEEKLSDQLPTGQHAEWLGTPPGELVVSVQQQFFGEDGLAVMVSYVSYPRARYEAFVFRMSLT